MLSQPGQSREVSSYPVFACISAAGMTRQEPIADAESGVRMRQVRSHERKVGSDAGLQGHYVIAVISGGWGI